MEIYKKVEELADQKIDETTLKELFSYKGYSFWWRFKELVSYAPTRHPTQLKIFYYTYIYYYSKILKDLLLRLLFSYTSLPSPSLPMIFTLLKSKSKFFREIHEEIKRQKLHFNLIVYYPILSTRSDLSNAKDTLPLEKFIDFSILQEERTVRRSFMKYEDAFLPYLQKLFPQYNPPQLRQVFRYAVLLDIPETFRLYKMAQKMLATLQPPILVVPNETGKYSYPLVVAAKKAGIKVAALQSGVYPYKSSRFFYYDRFVSKSADDCINFVVPDYTIVFGEKDKKFLKTLHVNPGSKFLPLGHPHYDALNKKIQNVDRLELVHRLGLPANKKIVLWATQTHEYGITREENERKAHMVFTALTAFKNSHQLAIKLHQGEDQRAPLYTKYNTLYKGIAKIYNRRFNIHDLLVVADAVIITSSTVGVEAILYGKPLLLLDTNPQKKSHYFISSRFDLLVQTSEDLQRYLGLVNMPAYQKKFEKLRGTFIKERYANFGSAAKEIVKFLKTFKG